MTQGPFFVDPSFFPLPKLLFNNGGLTVTPKAIPETNSFRSRAFDPSTSPATCANKVVVPIRINDTANRNRRDILTSPYLAFRASINSCRHSTMNHAMFWAMGSGVFF
jgi:hypothetical protein